MPTRPSAGQQVDERHEVRAQPGLVHRAVVDTVGLGRESRALHALDAEALDDAYAGDAFLDDARHVGELLLERHADGIHAVVETRRGEVEQRQQAEREQRKARAAQHEDDHDRDHLDRAGDRQRDEQDHVVDLLDVGVRVRHQLAGLGLVVETEVQALQVRDEPHADVGLDAPGEPERGVAAESGADGLHRADGDDRGGERPRHRGITFGDPLVDRRARQDRNRYASDGPDESGDDAEDHEVRVGGDRLGHQPPALLAGPFAFCLRSFFPLGLRLFGLADVCHLDRG